ncbi:MAG: NADH-quinone oxidoreductase subunit H [Chitinophagaceae bacterium]|nr:NADH-quinone oxidoreductase subunit H [Chitinophagaceae bacterium]
MSIFELEYNLVFASILSIFFGFCIVFTGYFSKSKYAFLASVRCLLLTINLELFLGFFMLIVVYFSESFCFSTFVVLQETF